MPMDASAFEHQLIDQEERFWKGDADFYEQHLTDDSLMVFAEPVGMLNKDRTVRTIASAPRWVTVAFEEPRIVHVREDVVLLAYKARASGEDDGAEYVTLASSLYVKGKGGWKLAFHQQTPGG